MNRLATFAILILIFFTYPFSVSAACNGVSLCDAPPGQCSTTATNSMTGASGPIYINNGGWVAKDCTTYFNCSYECADDDGCGSIPATGTNCENDPYVSCAATNVGGGSYICEAVTDCTITDAPRYTCSEVVVSTCCTPGCDASRYDCSGSTTPASSTPAPTLAPTAPPITMGNGGGSSGGNTDENNGSSGGGGAFCGDSACNHGESCSSCPSDCGNCPVSCGDGVCSGFETCHTCSSDCGVCPLLGEQPWWQTQGGQVYAETAIQSIILDSFCLAPDCIAQLMLTQVRGDVSSEGIALTGGGDIRGMNTINSRGQVAIGTKPTRYIENYAFFYRRSGLGLNPPNAFLGSAGDALKPTTQSGVGFHEGDVTIQQTWQVNADESVVIFIDGNVTLSDTFAVEQLIQVAEDGFLALIISGDLIVGASVGNGDVTNVTPNVEGVFIVDGTIYIQSDVDDKRFVGAGTFVGWTDVKLERDLGTDNATIPAEYFIYRPDFVRNTPDIMKHPHTIWQETN